jgi:hypothetical protein
MEKMIFFWLGWLLWILLYFFDQNKQRRFLSSAAVLVLIILSNWYVNIMGYRIFVPVLFVFLIGITLFSIKKRKLSTIVITMSLSFGYGGLLLWKHLNPLWIFFSISIIWAILGFITIMLFTKPNYDERIAIWLVSTSCGHIIYGLVRNSYGFYEPIGEYLYLVDLLLLIVIFTVVHMVKYLSVQIEQLVQNARVKIVKK